MRLSKAKKIELVEKLKTICDDEDFIGGTLNDCRNDEDIDSLLKYISGNDKLSSSDIILFQLATMTELGKHFSDDEKQNITRANS